MMPKQIRVLIIEDSEEDTGILIKELNKGQYELYWRRVDQQDTLKSALDENTWDLILSDYEMPGFGGLIALSIVHEKAPDIPFIFVSGVMGEATAVMAMKMGAADYVMKGNLQRLVPAIERELREFSIRRKHKQAEDAYKDQEGVIGAIASSVRDAIIMIDNDGNISFWNEAATVMLGYKREEAMGKNLHKLIVPAEYYDHFKTAFAGFRSSGEGHAINRTMELNAVNKKGLLFPVELSLSPVKTKGKWCAVGLLRDITERIRIKEELIKAKEKAEESSRLKSSLLLNINHELRTPMNGILGFARILKEAHTKPENIEMADTILTSGKRLMATLNSILDLAHIESDQTHVNPEIFNLDEEVQKVISNYEDLAKKKNIGLTDLTREAIFAEVDRNLFNNIILHLVDNAIKFTSCGSVTVKVEAEKSGKSEFATVKVIDTGIGIMPEQTKYIFEAFRQGSEGLARTYEGTGLGLTLCKKFVDLMGGAIELNSKPSEGSVFTVRFPRIMANVVEKQVSKEDVLPGSKHPIDERWKNNKPSVLIVEDNKANADLIEFFIGPFCSVDKAYDGYSAISKSIAKQYDLILMDINLSSEMNGIEAARAIRILDNYHDVPFIAITGYATPREKEEIMSNGFSHFIPKPFEREMLISAIKEALKLS
ncbi:MAG: response regulator [Bacteroidales bacterium]|nr:response regulator [Bacteroidales bacterium]